MSPHTDAGALLKLAAITLLAVFLAQCSKPPTADELYGCTVKQQAPNGECK